MVAGSQDNTRLSRRALLATGAAGAWIALTGSRHRTDGVYAPDGYFEGQDAIANRLRVRAFVGIRYAKALRFAAPVPILEAQQYRGALTAFGPACPQRGDRYQPQSEDCLFLNIWTPASNANAKRPVMVYFHGGAYSTGSVTDLVNDGAALSARGDVIVVTVNHRLNALGYLYLPDRFPDSGNNGQLDLIVALKWIRRNIAAFGGDPENVTLFGQSGGGAKIATLMAMPEAAGLFHKAITMSGQQITASGPANAAMRSKAFLAKLGEGIDLATAPVDQLIAALTATDPILGGGIYMGPVLDMRNLLRHPFWPDAPAQSSAIPMMLGNTIMETRAFYSAEQLPLLGLTMDNLAQRIAMPMRVDIEPNWVVSQFHARYPQADATELFHRIVTAARSWRGQVEEAEARARAGKPASGHTYVYQLNFEQGKHTDDIALSFGTVKNPAPDQQAMSNRMMDCFVKFARTGNPGWGHYDLEKRNTMVFDSESRVESDPRKWERELFAKVPYIQPGS